VSAEAIEAQVRARCESRAFAEAAAALVDGYGPEILRYLASLMRAPDDDLAEVFAMFCEDVVRGLPDFRFQSSVRTWSYTVARHARARFDRGNRRRGRRITLPDQLDEIVAKVQTRTATYLRTDAKERLAQARAELPPESQEILALRVDRQLGWRDIAVILAGDEPLDADALRRREQALRKRFETIKRQLRTAMIPPGRSDQGE
jgi:RNA polymerase sigma-70 factor (ECF subfamily)